VVNENHSGPAVSYKQRITIEQEHSIQGEEAYESKEEKLLVHDSNVTTTLKKKRK